MDPKEGDDGFVENLYRAIEDKERNFVKKILSSRDAADWGIKIVTREAGEESAGRRN